MKVYDLLLQHNKIIMVILIRSFDDLFLRLPPQNTD